MSPRPAAPCPAPTRRACPPTWRLGLLCLCLPVALRADAAAAAAGADAGVVADLIARSLRHVPGAADSGAAQARRAVAVAAAHPGTRLQAEALLNLGYYHYREAALDSARAYFAQALAVSETCADSAGIGLALNRLGNTDWLLDRQADARQAYERALALNRARGDAKETARSLNNLATVYREWGDYQAAIGLYLEARREYARAGDDEGAAWLDFSLTILHKKLGDHDRALASIGSALETYRRLAAASGDSAGVMICYGQLGDIYTQIGQPERGLEYQLRALRLREATGVQAAIADGLTGVGRAHFALGDDAAALAAFERSLELRRAAGTERGRETNLRFIGAIHRRRGQPELALRYLEDALTVARGLQERATEGEILAAVAAIHADAGDYEQAWKTQLQQQAVQSQVMNSEISKRVAALQVQHQVEAQAAQNERLVRDNQIKDLELARSRTRSLVVGLAALLVVVAAAAAAFLQRKRLQIRVLSGLIPICAHCKKIRNDAGYYEQLEKYITEHSEAEFTHGICEDCAKEWYGDYLGDKLGTAGAAGATGSA